MHNQIIYIVGPTGTGKTNLAVKLYQKIPSVLISADSRQVYRGMDIVPGKDHAKDVTIYGLDLVDPATSFSVSTWYDAVIPIIKQALSDGKTPIIVGGTGFYVQALTKGYETISTPINENLRRELNTLSVEALQARLKSLAPVRYSSMNHSDLLNPRRLIRAIEVALSPEHSASKAMPISTNSLSHRLYGIRYPTLAQQKEAIRARVLARLSGGAIAEAKELSRVASSQALSALGYPSLLSYLKGELDEQEMINEWVAAELSYVKRQLTYFRKLAVIWYDRTVVTDEEIIYDILQS